MRGIQIANELAGIPTNSSAGSFQSCTWELLADEDAWDRARVEQDESEDEISGLLDVSPQDAVGLMVQITYERANYKAILLGYADQKSSTPGFTSFPLMFLRMPVALKQLVLNYLSTTFDSRVVAMKLRPNFLSSVLEKILEGPTDAPRFSKGLQLQVVFPSVTPNLKSLDMSMSQSDLIQFIKQGNNHTRTHKGPVTGPFSRGLAQYLSASLALDFEHPGLVLDKFVLGPFALTSEGKVKVTVSSPEAKSIWNMLLEHAQSRMPETSND
jgi:hypothetical protein